MFERTADQELFEAATVRYIESEFPIERVRELEGASSTFDPKFWRGGAELGWTTLLAGTASGDSISGNGALDLLMVSHQFGRHATPSPLLDTNLVAAALGRWGTEQQRDDLLSRLVDGSATAAWAHAEPQPIVYPSPVTLTATDAAGGIRLDGIKSPVDSARDADVILVTAADHGGVSQILVARDTPGLEIEPLRSMDLTRRYDRLHFRDVHVPSDAVVGDRGGAVEGVEWLSDLAVTMQLGEMTGAMHWAFDITLEWTFNRYSFGRPLGSYQEIKHRVADMKLWLEASEAIAASAATLLGEGDAGYPASVSAGKFYVGKFGPELAQDCIQLHGGIGVTFDHDLHIFLRRITTDAALHGTSWQHAERLTSILEAGFNVESEES